MNDFLARQMFRQRLTAMGRVTLALVAARRYGPTTAKAVLAYKTRRQIINRSYQSKPDGIVGIMTMRVLDEEMVLSELRDAAARIKT